MKKFSWLLFFSVFLILALASFFRFYNLTRADVINDEVIIAFRSIGYIDFFSSPYQTTPWEWFSSVPAWARLSFHDHPPLVFLIQHWFFEIFGQSIFVLRLPFVLVGIISVFLVYLIGKKLFNEKTGLIASMLLAVLNYHVWISRTGLQESIVILLSLLTFYLFLRAQDSGRHWQWGITLGLAMITKYTSFVLAPIIVIYLLFFNRSIFKTKKIWLAFALAALIFSPVIIYNLKLYQATGHFDLQFFYLFGQKVPEWEYLPGKIQAGNFTDRIFGLIPSLFQGLLWPMFVLFILSLFSAGRKLLKNKVRFFSEPQIILLILAIFCHLALYLLIGPSKRFVVTVTPFIIILVAWFISRWPKIIKCILIPAIVALEIFFTVNTLFTYYPVGQAGLTYSYLNVESYNWGYNQLDDYLSKLLAGKKPAKTFQARYQFLEDIKNQAMAIAAKENKSPVAWLLIYDSDMYDLATFWLFHRRLVYNGWPIVTADDYLAKGKEFWPEQGLKDFYFIKIIDGAILLRPVIEQTAKADELQNQLKDLKPEIIKRPDGRPVFAIYHWQS
ncbi:MAG: glycosyltransferase family 39 protein [Candidatus Buchananbacteria bacterium]